MTWAEQDKGIFVSQPVVKITTNLELRNASKSAHSFLALILLGGNMTPESIRMGKVYGMQSLLFRFLFTRVMQAAVSGNKLALGAGGVTQDY